MEALQYDYNVLAARLSKIVVACDEMKMILEETKRAKDESNNLSDVMEYLQTNLWIISHR
jgi:chaperonin cofactor prefoldin